MFENLLEAGESGCGCGEEVESQAVLAAARAGAARSQQGPGEELVEQVAPCDS